MSNLPTTKVQVQFFPESKSAQVILWDNRRITCVTAEGLWECLSRLHEGRTFDAIPAKPETDWNSVKIEIGKFPVRRVPPKVTGAMDRHREKMARHIENMGQGSKGFSNSAKLIQQIKELGLTQAEIKQLLGV